MRGIVGIGLVALDIVIDDATDERIGVWAGGSCGNVLAILSWLGWRAAPVARLNAGHNATLIRQDLRRWKVDERWLAVGPAAPAPLFIERLRRREDGTVTHSYDRFCPACGGRLPGYQPVARSALDGVVAELGNWDILYIDRPSAGAVRLARTARDRGMLVVFEPSARGSDAHTVGVAECAHIVKYSSARLSAADRDAITATAPALEVETLGEAGLRYRRAAAEWRILTVPKIVAQDTAGAGDWTTAGMLVALSNHDATTGDLSERAVRDVLRFAQGLGAWSCRFQGPRGAMERTSPRDAVSAAVAIRGGVRHPARRRRPRSTAGVEWACLECRSLR